MCSEPNSKNCEATLFNAIKALAGQTSTSFLQSAPSRHSHAQKLQKIVVLFLPLEVKVVLIWCQQSLLSVLAVTSTTSGYYMSVRQLLGFHSSQVIEVIVHEAQTGNHKQ